MVTANNISVDAIWNILKDVQDPEVPVLSVLDLGIVRNVLLHHDQIEVVITPTYTGCPAMDMIAMNIRLALLENDFKNIKITTVLSPAWTTDWMSDAGKRKLLAYGIVPPQPRPDRGPRADGGSPVMVALSLRCPQCGSGDTRELSRFGSTACKSLWVCNSCKEPFDHFKSH